VWLEDGGDIIDFSCGDWREDMPLIEGFSAEQLERERGLRPVSFEVAPPAYVWRPAAELTSPWTATGTPALGDLWYHRGVRCADEEEAKTYFHGALEDAGPVLQLLWPRVRERLPEPLH